MKARGVVIAFALSIQVAFAQQTLPMDSLYIVTYTTGPKWDHSKAPNEQPYFTEHSANLGKLRKEGVIKAGARYAEKGIIFITASSLVAAREIIFGDQAVVNQLFVADVQKLNVFYDGCIERPRKN